MLGAVRAQVGCLTLAGEGLHSHGINNASTTTSPKPNPGLFIVTKEQILYGRLTIPGTAPSIHHVLSYLIVSTSLGSVNGRYHQSSFSVDNIEFLTD